MRLGDGEPTGMTALPDGRVWVCGQTLNNTAAVIWSVGADGAPDASFGVNGRRAYDATTTAQWIWRLRRCLLARCWRSRARGTGASTGSTPTGRWTRRSASTGIRVRRAVRQVYRPGRRADRRGLDGDDAEGRDLLGLPPDGRRPDRPDVWRRRHDDAGVRRDVRVGRGRRRTGRRVDPVGRRPGSTRRRPTISRLPAWRRTEPGAELRAGRRDVDRPVGRPGAGHRAAAVVRRAPAGRGRTSEMLPVRRVFAGMG